MGVPCHTPPSLEVFSTEPSFPDSMKEGWGERGLSEFSGYRWLSTHARCQWQSPGSSGRCPHGATEKDAYRDTSPQALQHSRRGDWDPPPGATWAWQLNVHAQAEPGGPFMPDSISVWQSLPMFPLWPNLGGGGNRRGSRVLLDVLGLRPGPRPLNFKVEYLTTLVF